MAGGRPSAGKRARERARQERAAEKAERKRERAAEAASPTEPSGDTLGEDELVARLRRLQEQLDDGSLDIEAFQDARAELMERYSG
jgi:hypothetical protein